MKTTGKLNTGVCESPASRASFLRRNAIDGPAAFIDWLHRRPDSKPLKMSPLDWIWLMTDQSIPKHHLVFASNATANTVGVILSYKCLDCRVRTFTRVIQVAKRHPKRTRRRVYFTLLWAEQEIERHGTHPFNDIERARGRRCQDVKTAHRGGGCPRAHHRLSGSFPPSNLISSAMIRPANARCLAGLLLYAGGAMMKTQNTASKPLRVPEEIPSRRE
jgi:hypothetical protein